MPPPPIQFKDPKKRVPPRFNVRKLPDRVLREARQEAASGLLTLQLTNSSRAQIRQQEEQLRQLQDEVTRRRVQREIQEVVDSLSYQLNSVSVATDPPNRLQQERKDKKDRKGK
jgi:TolA-binding protein